MEEGQEREAKTRNLGLKWLDQVLKYGGRESTPPAVGPAHTDSSKKGGRGCERGGCGGEVGGGR
jgi:hypothetical protein